MRYFIPDIETGYKVEVTKEQHEAYLKAWDLFTPKISDEHIGRTLVFGTSGELDKEDDLSNVFYKPENYKIMPEKTAISNEEIFHLLTNRDMTIEQVIDVVVDTNGLIGVGLITLGDVLKEYCYKHEGKRMSEPKNMDKEKAIRICQQVAEDMARYAENFDGKPFNGKTVAKYLGNQGAAIAALAEMIESIIERDILNSP